MCFKAKLDGADEGKILDDMIFVCCVQEGMPCAIKAVCLPERDVLNLAQP